MKTYILKATGIFLVCLTIILTLASCTSNGGLKLISGELIKTSDGVSGIFKLLNQEKSKADNLEITIKALDKNGNEIGTADGRYAIYVDPGHEATITVILPRGCEKAEAISCRYTVDNNEKSCEFTENNVAVFSVDAPEDEKIDTREELAEKLIEDIEHQFMLQKYEAHGYYDKEKKQVIIASYTNKTYEECEYAHYIEPSAYNALAESIKQMSSTCYEEFKNYKFDDVKVTIGFLSSDEKIMISATNGEIVDNFN